LREVHSGTKSVAEFPNLEFGSEYLLRNVTEGQDDFFFMTFTIIRFCNLRGYTYEWLQKNAHGK
jgi:hypothetical protein